MDLLKRISRLFTSSGDVDDLSQWVYVQCGRCGEKLRARINMRNDLSVNYDGIHTTYFTRKTLIGDKRCYQPIEVELTYDAKRQLIDKAIKGGEFIDADAYYEDEEESEIKE